MPERIMPGLGLRAFYDPGQRDWGTSVSEDLRALSVLVQARALSRSTVLPAPGSAGDIYIVPAGAAEHPNVIALWDEAAGTPAWVFLTPQEGWQVWVTDVGRILETTGVSGVTVTIPAAATVPFETGTLIHLTQVGAGTALVQAAAGVSLNGVTGGAVALDGPWSGAALTKRGADAWTVQGALAGPVA